MAGRGDQGPSREWLLEFPDGLSSDALTVGLCNVCAAPSGKMGVDAAGARNAVESGGATEVVGRFPKCH